MYDVLEGVSRFELLMLEYQNFVKQCSNLDNHSPQYLLGRAYAASKTINRIAQEPDDDYHSGAAALYYWMTFRRKLLDTANKKLL